MTVNTFKYKSVVKRLVEIIIFKKVKNYDLLSAVSATCRDLHTFWWSILITIAWPCYVFQGYLVFGRMVRGSLPQVMKS